MLKPLADLLFAAPEERAMKAYRKKVDAINALEAGLTTLSDDDLKGRAIALRTRVRSGTKLDAVMAEAFAVVREAAKRVLGQRHYDVQLIGGMIMHDGMLAEMRTGEGKTLVATLAAFLNALPGDGVHVVTANDYLSRRDFDLMAPVHRLLDLTVGYVGPDSTPDERREAYACDITYTTNNQVGFDHLKDGMVLRAADKVQRPFNFAIVDEVDSILIDEARTPLIISGADEDNSLVYEMVDRFVVRVPVSEVERDDKEKSVNLSEAGLTRIESMMRNAQLLKDASNLHDPQNGNLLHHVTAGLRAHHMFKRDTHYIVQDGEIVLVDEFTGRTLAGRRFSDGIHQALEAKERVKVNPESLTIASITLQNLFRSYRKLSGMTGTAMTEDKEFADIYGIGVVAVPTHRPVIRKDQADMIYRTHAEKIAAIVKAVDEAHAKHQPVLVGTASIESSEEVSKALEKAGYQRLDFDDAMALEAVYAAALDGTTSKRFAVLSAKHNRQEAYIIGQAGIPGAITVATNMAGRGTDIQLGGNVEMRIERETATLDPSATLEKAARIRTDAAIFKEKAREAGGLFVVGTERHESRRIDNQLRGRSGRQGDPGRSQFFLAFTDALIMRFGKLDFLADQLELKEGEAISHRMVSGSVDKAQAKQEAHNFEIRKTVIKFDDVINEQRKAVHEERTRLLTADDISDLVEEMRENWIDGLVSACVPARSYVEQWNIERLKTDSKAILDLDLPLDEWTGADEAMSSEDLADKIKTLAKEAYDERREAYGERFDREVVQHYSLIVLDMAWREHMADLDHLKQVVGWRAIGQRDPVSEFRVDAAEGFNAMIDKWHEHATKEFMRDRTPKTVEAA